jgi:diguanylate cyclase (GGDEF)-like protein
MSKNPKANPSASNGERRSLSTSPSLAGGNSSRALRSPEFLLNTVLEKIGQGVCFFDGSMRLIIANARYAELYGIPAKKIRQGMELSEIVALRAAAGSLPVKGAAGYLKWRRRVARTNKPQDSIVELSDGRFIRIHHEPLADSGWVATHDDITEQRRSEAELRRRHLHFDAAIANMSQGLVMFDVNERMIVCNHNYLAMFGMADDVVKPGVSLLEILQHSVDVGVAAVSAQELYDIRRAVISKSKPTTYRETLTDGRNIDISHRPMADGGWVSTYEDTTERRHAEARIAFMATHDSLTGLPNRAFFGEKISQLPFEDDGRRTGAADSFSALLLLDLDRFKVVNDTLGHAAGDKLLCLVADRLKSALRQGDFAARLGGDEFSILPAARTLEEIADLSRRIIGAVTTEPYDLDGHWASIGASIGISLVAIDASDPQSLMKSADLALYHAKSQGRGSFAFFAPEMAVSKDALRALRERLDALKSVDRSDYRRPALRRMW